jgi:hypothetical protein
MRQRAAGRAPLRASGAAPHMSVSAVVTQRSNAALAAMAAGARSCCRSGLG